MLLTTKLGAAMAATAAASFVAGAALGPTQASLRAGETTAALTASVSRPAKADRMDADQLSGGRRTACLNQDWLRLSSDCAELFTRTAQAATAPTTTILVRDTTSGSTTAIRVPRPESDLAFR